MTDDTLSLTAALAGAEHYGWDVTHFPGGFDARRGGRVLTVVFAPGTGFVAASIRNGDRDMTRTLLASDVIGTLARYGQPGPAEGR